MIIGATDSGKSTLSKYLLNKLMAVHERLAVVDSDVGQSALGLPGTIGMKTFSGMGSRRYCGTHKTFFVGTVNAAKRIPFIIRGTLRLTDLSRKRSHVVLIDTSGLIAGEIGRSLKIRKIEAVRPDRVIALQRGDELEHILLAIKNVHVYRIRVSHMARVRSRGERARYRREKLHSYFNPTKLKDFSLGTEGLEFIDGLREITDTGDIVKQGAIIGLNVGEDTMALGVLIELTAARLIFRAPADKEIIKRVDRIVVGDMVL